MISVLILTLNEAPVLPGCLDALTWCDDILVFDSFSSDDTVQVAKRAGARVLQKTFVNYADQRNTALQTGGFKHSWVLMVDADERVPLELVEEMKRILATGPDAVAMYRMRRKDMLLGQWIKRSSGYPTWFGRLVQPKRVRVTREINEEYHADGEVRYLQEHLTHFPFAKGFKYWIERHNRYSTMEAELLMAETSVATPLSSLFTRDPVIRRKSLKRIAYRLPGRPLLIFLYLYFFRLGVLDGRAGFTFCTLRMFYEFMIDLKLKELRRRNQGLPL